MDGKIGVYVKLSEEYNPETDRVEQVLAYAVKDWFDESGQAYYAKDGLIFVQEVEVHCDTSHITLESVKRGVVEGLRAKMEQIRADAEATCTSIQFQINTLLALTYQEPAAKGEFAPRRNNDGAEDVIPF